MFKYEQIYNNLLNKINSGEFDNSMLPTEIKITEDYHVSRITAQKAYELLEKDGLITRVAGKGTILARASAVTATTATAATNVVKRNLIGVVFCDIDSAFGQQLLLSIEKIAADNNYSIIFKRSLDNPESEERILSELIEYGVCGIIIQNCHGDFTKLLMKLSCSEFPIVSIDRRTSRLPICSVSSNNSEITTQLTDYLFNLGHKNLVFISSSPIGTSTLSRRVEGYKQSFINNGVPMHPENLLLNLVSPITRRPEDRQNDLDKLSQHLINNPNITAIIASERYVGALAKQTFEIIGKSCPKDYSLVCFDHEELFDNTPVITHVAQNQTEMGRQAFFMLNNLINGDKEIKRIEIPSKIVYGNTTAKLSK